MKTTLVLDTCVLPQKGALTQNPLLSALLRVARLQDYDVLVSEMVRIESLGQRQRAASEALGQLRAAIRIAAGVFGPDQLDYYLPSETDAVQRWKDDLDSLGHIPLDGDDAIEALRREALRQPPARPTADGSATGGRDAAIWLAVKRLHSSSEDRQTYFVSSNTGDFADRKDADSLRSELLTELGEAADRFIYCPSLASVIEHMAEQSPTKAIGATEIARMLSEGQVEAFLLDAARELAPVRSQETVLDEAVTVESAEERRAYNVGDTRLAMADIQFTLVKHLDTGVEDEVVERQVKGRARIWFYETDLSLLAELESFKLIDETSTEATVERAGSPDEARSSSGGGEVDLDADLERDS